MRNGKKAAIRMISWAGMFIAFAFVFDRACYRIFFPLYDGRSTLSGMLGKQGGIVVGSSHTRWGISKEILTQKTGLNFEVFAPPGANVELRSAIIQDYCKLQNCPPVVVMELQALSFNPKRYPLDAYKTLLGYYPRGILNNYLETKYTGEERKFLVASKFSNLVSLNEEFYFMTSQIADSLANPVRFLRDKVRPPKSIEPEKSHLTESIEIWRKFYDSQGYGKQIKPELVTAYRDFLNFASAQKQTTFLLLDIPLYRLDEKMERDFDEPRKLIQSGLPPNVHYVRIQADKIERDPTWFFDTSHLNPTGKDAYSALLGDEIVRLRK